MCIPVIDMVATGERIKELRRENNLRVADICDFLGLTSEQSVFKWQRGESLPTIDNMCALSRLFNTSLEGIIRFMPE